LSDRLLAVSGDVQRVIEREIPALRDDQRVVDMLEASVAENVATIVHALRYGIDVSTVEAPTSAVEYARRLAQRGVDAAALLRAYRIGQARFIRLFMGRQPADRLRPAARPRRAGRERGAGGRLGRQRAVRPV